MNTTTYKKLLSKEYLQEALLIKDIFLLVILKRIEMYVRDGSNLSQFETNS